MCHDALHDVSLDIRISRYKFGFQNGAEVTVYSRPWEKHLEVLEVKKGTSLDAQAREL